MEPLSTKPSDAHGELECTLCKETYKKPKLLHCMHTFCDGCIQKLPRVDPNCMVICPICNHKNKVGQNQELLWTNHIIQKKIEKEKLAAMKAKEMIYCTECETNVATQFCCDCKLKLCGDCSSHHKKCARYNGHKIESMKDIPEEALLEPVVMICHKHEQTLKYYCETCQTSSCGDCTLSKVHQNHTFRLLDEMMEEEMESLKQLIPNARLKGKDYEIYLKRVEEFMETAAQNKESSTKVIEETFDALINILQTEKDNVLRWINETYDSSEDSFKRAKDELKIIGPATEYLEEIMEYPKEEVSDVVLEGTKQLKEVVKNMEDVTARKPTDTQNVFDVTACTREVVKGAYLEMIKSAMKQISLLQQSALPLNLALMVHDPGRFIRELHCTEQYACPYENVHGCTYLPGDQYCLPRSIYLPHAFTSSEIKFQK